jgi:RHS repeat-associated protein
MRSSADARAGTRLEYRYDAAGNRVALRVEPGGLDITSEYDERGNLSSVTDALGGTTVVTYDERGRERSRSFPNGVERQTSYTVDGLVSGIVYRNARRGVIAGEAYVYDEAGRRRLRADAQGRVAVYEYDSDGRLTRVAYPTRDSGSPTFTSLTRGQMHDLLAALTTAMPERKSLLSAVQPARVQTFRYDARGNRSRMTEGSVAVEYDYDVDGRLRASGATRYQHDTRGNLIAVEGPERTVDLAYGSRNRVTRAEVRMRGAARPEQGEAVIEFGYDPLGRRVRREDIGEAASPSVRGAGAGRTVTRYVHDQLSVTPVAIVRVASGPARELTGPKPGAPDPGRYHRLDGRRASTGGAVAVESLLVWLDGELLAKRGPVHDDMGYCGVDERGSRIVTFDQTGGVRDRISYDAFGNTSDPGAMYSGKLRDPDTGLYDYGYRDYDSATGRFTTVDPVKDGTNWYSFLGSDPVNRRDPNGLFITVGPGLGYDHRSDRYRTTDARSIRDKSRIHITRNSDSDDFYNDTMQLKVDELVLTDAAVQSEADTPGKEHQTVPTGRYEGYLLDYSGSYDDPILLENESKGVPAGHGYLIHPNEYTNPTRIAEVLSQGRHIGPWNQPFSEGCQITRGREAAVKIRTEIGRLGFRTSPHSHFRESAGVIKDPDSIAVQIKNR